MTGTVVWLTGKPSSGKSTLAKKIAERLGELSVPSAVLDGDQVRAALVPKPGYDEASRDCLYETLANLAALLAGQGFIVLVAATAHLRSFRARARERAPAFLEVYVNATQVEVEARDAKGLYRAAENGAVSSLPGKNVAYEEPLHPDVVASGGLDADAVERVISLCRESP